jgi:hypothetical protein
LVFFILLHSLFWNLLPLYSPQQQHLMYCEQGCGMSLGTQGFASCQLAIHPMLFAVYFCIIRLPLLSRMNRL